MWKPCPAESTADSSGDSTDALEVEGIVMVVALVASDCGA